MPNQQVVSREYKLMLKEERFKGDQKALMSAAERLWRDVTSIVSPYVDEVVGDLNEIKVERLIRFFDTGQQHLKRNRYIFRERTDLKTGEREVTLKFRHADRYYTQDRSMAARKSGKAKTKFEEDVKAQFSSLFSYSTTQPVNEDDALEFLRHVRDLFPDVADRLDEFLEGEPLAVVQDFTARELVIAGGAFDLSKKDKVLAPCALVIWYRHGEKLGPPVAAEFSFRYGSDDEDYDGTITRRAYDAFLALQSNLDWVDPKPRTKTSFVYSE